MKYEFEITIGFKDKVPINDTNTNTYTVFAESEEEAFNIALERAKEDLLVVDVYLVTDEKHV